MRPTVERGGNLRRDKGSLGPLHPELAVVKYSRIEEGAAVLHFQWEAPVFSRLRGQPLKEAESAVAIRRGMKVFSNFWEFEIDSSNP